VLSRLKGLATKTGTALSNLFCRLCPNCGIMLYGKICSCGYADVKEFISLDLYFRCYSRNPEHPAYNLDFRSVDPYASEFNQQILDEATELVKRVNSLFTQLEELTGREFKLTLTSGWRPPTYSREIGTSTRSPHTKGKAVDIADGGGSYKRLIRNNAETEYPDDLLHKLDLWMEHEDFTPTWIHIDTHDRWERDIRIFRPY